MSGPLRGGLGRWRKPPNPAPGPARAAGLRFEWQGRRYRELGLGYLRMGPDEVLDRLESTVISELGRIEHALSHLDRGRGNQCECCGRTISRKRLSAVIHATQCEACARKLASDASTSVPAAA